MTITLEPIYHKGHFQWMSGMFVLGDLDDAIAFCVKHNLSYRIADSVKEWRF